MNLGETTFTTSLRGRAPTLLIAALCVGVLDIAFATTFWSVQGVAPVRVLQSIADGLVGSRAYAGGIATALLGLGLHFFIAFLMVLAYHAMALRFAWLTRRPWRAGPLYGVVLYLFMTYVVVPLSAAGPPSSRVDWIVGSVLSHVFLVGLPCALFVRAAHQRRRLHRV